MLRAQAEDLQGVADVGVSGCRSHPLGPRLDLGTPNLHAAPAHPAHHVMMMPRRLVHLLVSRAAQSILRLALIGVYDVCAAVLGQQIQVPVHGGQPDPFTLFAQRTE